MFYVNCGFRASWMLERVTVVLSPMSLNFRPLKELLHPRETGSGNGRPRIETKVLLGYLSATSIKGRNRRERARASLFSRCSARGNAATRPYVYLREEGIGLTPSEP